MDDEQTYIHEDDGTPWSGAELTDELRSRGLAVSGTNADKLERLEANDRGEAEGETAAEDDGATEYGPDTDVSDHWAVFARLDGSQYIVCLADVAELPDDVRPRTEPENDTDVMQPATVTP